MEATKIINHIKHNGIARTNRFRVNIGLGEAMLQQLDGTGKQSDTLLTRLVKAGSVILGGSSQVARSLSLMCEGSALPGSNISTQEIRIVGQLRKQPYGVLHDDIQFTFLVSGDMLEKKVFDMWMNEVVNRKTAVVGFYKDYTSDISVDQLDTKGRVIYSITLEEAYPIIVTDMGLAAGESDNIHRINVSFTYRRWRYSDTETTEKPTFEGISAFAAVENIIDGNYGDALVNGLQLVESVRNNNFTGEALAAFDMIDNVLRSSTGISASDVERVLRNISGDINLNPRLSEADRANLQSVIDDVIGAI